MICPTCNQEVEKLTRDHVVPKWLLNPSKLKLLGVKPEGSWIEFCNRTKLMRRICADCNLKKGGKVDYKDETTREFMQYMVDKIQENLHPFKV